MDQGARGTVSLLLQSPTIPLTAHRPILITLPTFLAFPNSAREEAIAIEMVKNLREKVAWCQREHPVTHYYDCAEIVGKYLTLVKVRRTLGWVGGWVGGELK